MMFVKQIHFKSLTCTVQFMLNILIYFETGSILLANINENHFFIKQVIVANYYLTILQFIFKKNQFSL